ncbi:MULTISPECIES: YicC/YloC family endoribonuclease [unclassified Wenzhouxiangella]|uniref:YicC/YloC family endoribonuclease n=1 Tax=unclassified Wenzhouxiangella TaxID=2613841 RepID=UPI000E32B701|nr:MULTISPECIES: YicC/YloC family endoribonuclease [unclassified Wenzhouxiangella]RFF27309.1 YicC family protein [Wenzhouxiangella sp. 15181]RFP68742.1 YicC family protein [Wenzhouxiangella sp. 15190]
MIRSMTAYARRSGSLEVGQVTWELRSVNQRFLDLSLRLPEDFRPLEPGVRGRLKERLGRGKVEVSLKFQPDPAVAAADMRINIDIARNLLRAHDDIADLAGGSAEPDLVHLLSWPGLVEQADSDLESAFDPALDLLDEAIDALVAAREQEGRAIADMLEQRLAGIEAQASAVRERLPSIREALDQRMRERLESLDVSVDPGRIEQEVVMQLQKLDVDEELDRLDAHIAEVRRVMALDEPVGRRLDFLMQELNREANTLGSKATLAEVGQAAVELKVLVEQMREQVQNVE